MPADRSVLIWRSVLLPGSETFIRNQGSALTRWRPTYLGAVKADSVLAADSDLIAFADRWGFLWLRLTGGSAKLRRLVVGARPEVIHAHFGGDGWLISRTAKRLGIPLVITLHGLDVTRQAGRPGPIGDRYRRNLRTAFDRAGLVLAVSEHIRGRAIALGADPAKVRVHHTGVPLPSLEPAVKRWDVAFVGRFVPKKGIDDLVEALGEARGARSLFIGAGPLSEQVQKRAAELGLDATFLGAQEPAAVARHLAESKIFVAPSKTAPDGDAEGLPTTILEAASLGLPTVSTRHSGIPEAVLDGETGLLGPEGDRATLAANIRRLLDDDALRDKLGAAARRHIETNFDLAAQTRHLEDLYASLAGRPLSG